MSRVTSLWDLQGLFDPLTPVPPEPGRDEPRPFFHSDVIPFDQNWHYLYSTCAGGKHLSNDAQIRVTGRMGDMHKNAQKVE